MADKPTTPDKGDPDDTEHPNRDPFGFLEGRPWYRHPLVILTIAGAASLALTFFMAATRTAGVPIFG